LRLVGGDHTTYAAAVVRAVREAVADDPDARVALVGHGQGGVTAAEVASATDHGLVIDHVVTAGAPAAQAARIPESTRVLSLEDRADPVALLGSLLNAGERHRVTVVFDGADTGGESVYVAGGRAADAAAHPQLRAELDRLREGGWIAG
jgi:alpha-beta hydrolase superfamily lysophospholipase